MNHCGRILIAVTVGIACAVCSAIVIINPKGTWPASWPKELEPLRDRATTVRVSHGIQETVYEIPFTNREEFERVWPYILTLKSKGAPLILEKAPSTYSVSGSTMPAGVRVLWPSDGTTELPDGTRLAAKAPWPESVLSISDELPEYVMVEGGKWVAVTEKNRKDHLGFLHRCRVDIVLVTDGQVVDLNRIGLPAGTPIVDTRFVR